MTTQEIETQSALVSAACDGDPGEAGEREVLAWHDARRKSSKVQIDPMRLYVASMGKIFRVTHVCLSMQEANAVCERHRDTAVIAEDPNGLVYLAEQYGAVCPSAVMADINRR
jgi:hypothetical protein